MKRSHLLLLLPALVASSPSFADERLFLQVPATIDAAASLPAAVRRECGVEQLMASQALSAMNKRIRGVQAIENPEQAGDGNLVELTIMSGFGAGGGGITGSKSMTIRANLKKSGAVVATTLLTRESSRGFMGAMMTGTCSVFERIAGALGKDVAVWLSRDVGAQAGVMPRKAAEAAPEPAPATDK